MSASHPSSTAGIAVVVPFYDAQAHLARCIDALLAQEDVPVAYDVTLVDNNSTDASPAIARGYGNRIRLLAEAKQSSYAARNRGAAATAAPVLAFIDADCVADARWLAQLSRALAPGVQVVQGRRVYDVAEGPAAMLAAYEAERAAYVFARGSSDIAFGYTNNMAVRREAFERCGPFDAIARGADSLFVRRVLDVYGPGSVVYARDAVIRHLEIGRVADLFRKKMIYGRSAYRNYDKANLRHRDLTRPEIFEILRATVRRNGYSVAQTLRLALLLRVGSLYFRLGRMAEKWRDRRAAVDPVSGIATS